MRKSKRRRGWAGNEEWVVRRNREGGGEEVRGGERRRLYRHHFPLRSLKLQVTRSIRSQTPPPRISHPPNSPPPHSPFPLFLFQLLPSSSFLYLLFFLHIFLSFSSFIHPHLFFLLLESSFSIFFLSPPLILLFSSRRHRRWAKGAMDSTSVFFLPLLLPITFWENKLG